MSYPLDKACAVILLLLAVPATAYAQPGRTQSFSGSSYLVCSFDLTRDDLRTYWHRDNGQPYRTFAALAEDLERKGKLLRFAMNGGMYRSDFGPVGLYIENGHELAPANTTIVTGAPGQIPNFYKRPNGVFYVGDDQAGVVETERFLAARPHANFATQSGPMLVIDGEIHPAFIVGSCSSKVCMAELSLEVVGNHTARWLRELTSSFGLIQPWGVWRRDAKGRN